MIKIYFLNTVSILFKLLSLIHLKIKSLRKKEYKNTFIISIDNLSFGGTGKTPLVLYIAEELRKNGKKCCIITRGYKSKYENEGIKVSPSHSIRDIGDEAVLFKRYLPKTDIYIGKNRRKSIEKAINDNNSIIILDDGFQTTDIFKDLKIMLLNPNHHYYFLRNFKFLARKEDLILKFSESLKTQNSYKFKIYGIFDLENNKLENTVLKEKIIGFSALGDNERFKKTLEILNTNLILFKSFKDHYAFDNSTITQLNKIRKDNSCSYIICSEKDYIKIKNLNLTNIPLIYIKNKIQLNINLIEKIIRDAEKKGIIKT